MAWDAISKYVDDSVSLHQVAYETSKLFQQVDGEEHKFKETPIPTFAAWSESGCDGQILQLARQAFEVDESTLTKFVV